MAITFTTTLATPVSDYSVTVSEAVEMVNRSLVTRDHSEDRVKDAIEQAVNHALRETHCNMRVYGFQTEPGQDVYSLESVVEDGPAARVLGAWIGYRSLTAMDWRELARRQAMGVQSGEPTRYSSRVPSEVSFFASPDGTYNMSVKAWASCVNLGAGSTVINVPREFLIPILRNGAAGLVAANSPDARATTGWLQFLRDDLPSIKRACYASQVFVKPFVAEA